MITKKLWNTLSEKTRREYIEIVYGDNPPEVYKWFINNNYYHDFCYDDRGGRLKRLLSYGRLQSDGSIDIVLTIQPTYLPHKVSSGIGKSTIKKWKIDYIDTSEDLNHVWLAALSSSDAEEKVKRGYHDIDHIINISEIKE